jgi:hypothetical protein
MAQQAARKRITPVLVAPLDPSAASTAAGGIGSGADGAALASPGVAGWRHIPPAAPPTDPDAISKLGPARRIYVDLAATTMVNFREVRGLDGTKQKEPAHSPQASAARGAAP